MTTAVMNYVFSPLSGIWGSITRTTEIIGYSRAAAELARHGYHEEAKRCMLQVVELRQAEKNNTAMGRETAPLVIGSKNDKICFK